jgi:hypothetical protein
MISVRLLGVAQLVVCAASLIGERLLAAAVGSGSVSRELASIAKRPRLVPTVLALLGGRDTPAQLLGSLYTTQPKYRKGTHRAASCVPDAAHARLDLYSPV